MNSQPYIIGLLFLLMLFPFSLLAQPDDGNQPWSAFPGAEGFSKASVNAIVVSGDSVYFGGEFTRVGEMKATNIVLWDRKQDLWMPLGKDGNSEGVEGTVQSIQVVGGKVYVGGSFNRAGGVDVQNLALWDGEKWSGIGDGLAGEVRKIALHGDTLYALRERPAPLPPNDAGGLVFQWDGNAWTDLLKSSGLSTRRIYDIMLDREGRLFVGGGQHDTTGAPENPKFYASSFRDSRTGRWQLLSDSGTSYAGYMTQFTQTQDGTIYVLVPFNGSLNRPDLYVLQDTLWVKIENSQLRDPGYLAPEFNAMIASPNGDLFVTGRYIDSASGEPVNDIARWDGTRWHPLGDGLSYGGNALAWDREELIVGGTFTFAGDEPALGIASWNGSRWKRVGDGVSGGGKATMQTITVAPDDMVYVGGSFNRIGREGANHIAQWDGARWEGLGKGVDLAPTALLRTSNGSLMVGGGTIDLSRMTRVGGTLREVVAEWADGTWQSTDLYDVAPWFLGAYSLLEADDGTIYVGGDLVDDPEEDWHVSSKFYPSLFYRIGDRWIIDSNTRGLIVDMIPYRNGIYMGGSFEHPGSGSTIYLMISYGWTGNAGFLQDGKWTGGTGPFRNLAQNGGFVSALAADERYLYAGGRFDDKSNRLCRGIARFDTLERLWKPLGEGVQIAGDTVAGWVQDIVVKDGQVFATGEFGTAGGLAAQNIARWDGTAWQPLGSGLNGRGNQFAVGLDNRLYVVGEFSEAGGIPVPGIAVWGEGGLSVDADEETSSKEGMTAYYDSRTGSVIVERTRGDEESQILLYDLLGRVVLREQFGAGTRQKRLGVEHLAQGPYIVMTSPGEKSGNVRLIISN